MTAVAVVRRGRSRSFARPAFCENGCVGTAGYRKSATVDLWILDSPMAVCAPCAHRMVAAYDDALSRLAEQDRAPATDLVGVI